MKWLLIVLFAASLSYAGDRGHGPKVNFTCMKGDGSLISRSEIVEMLMNGIVTESIIEDMINRLHIIPAFGQSLKKNSNERDLSIEEFLSYYDSVEGKVCSRSVSHL